MMKKILVILILLFSKQIFSQEPQQKLHQITVQGSVELKEVADRASLSFSVKGVGSSLRIAVEIANKKTKEITDKLFVLGVKGKDISTSSFYSGENQGDKAFLSSSRDYQASISTIIRIDSLKLLESIILTISESDVQSLSEITFSLKDEAGFRRRARIEAALKAKEKAEDISKALSATLGKVVSIDELQQSNTMQTQLRGGMVNPFNPVTNNSISNEEVVISDGNIGTGFFAQTISIKSQLYVTFELK